MNRIIAHFLFTSASAFAFTSLAGATPVSGQMTLLPDIPASQIAQDAQRSYDSQTGISTVTAQSFDPFEQDSTLAGTAALRQGPSAVTLGGKHTAGGAFLDLKMIYTRPSNDPYDVRGFERAVYISGEPIDRIRQDIRTLDCASNTTEVIYEDNYYDHYSPYGLIAGLYLAMPRYRGHRGYWSGNSYRRPHRGWSQWRTRARGHGYSGHGYSSHSYDSGAGFGGGRNSRGDTSGRRGDRSRGDRNGSSGRDNGINTSREDRVERHNGGNVVIGRSGAHREYVDRRGVRTGGTATGRNGSSRTGTTRPTTGRTSRDGRGTRAGGANTRGTRGTVAASTPAPIARQSSPAPVARPTSRPAPTSRPVPNTDRPARRVNKKTRVKPITKPRPERKEPKRESRRSKRIDRAVDRSFKKSPRAKSRKHMDFFPALGGYSRSHSNYADVQTDYRCVREESVTLHIPQDRLDAARFDGMTLVLVDNADRDVAVYIPPNYIEGFRQATGRSTQGTSHRAPTHQAPSHQAPSYQAPQPQPEAAYPQGSYPQD